MAIMRQAPRSEVIQQIDAVSRVYVRLTLTTNDAGEFEVRSLLVDVLPRPWVLKPSSMPASWLSTPLTDDFLDAEVEQDSDAFVMVQPAPNDTASAIHPKVFIGYSHDTAQHARRVLAFAERPRLDGIDCSIDQYEEAPPQGWPQWMEDQIEWAEFILVVCTQTYKRRFRGKEAEGKGLGATWEGAILTQQLYNQAAKNATIIPIVFAPEDVVYIPTVLEGQTRYNVSDGFAATKLYRRLTNQPLIVKPRWARSSACLSRTTSGPSCSPRARSAHRRASRLYVV